MTFCLFFCNLSIFSVMVLLSNFSFNLTSWQNLRMRHTKNLRREDDTLLLNDTQNNLTNDIEKTATPVVQHKFKKINKLIFF